MSVHGLCLRVTHTGLARASLPLNDINDGVGRDTGDDRFRRFGPGYVPVDATIELVYAGDVAKSFESGTIRGYIDGGHLTAEFFVGLTLAAIFPDIEDEGVPLTPTPTVINFVGSGVTATATGDEVTVTIPGGGAATDHSTLSTLAWPAAGHTGTPNTLAGFDGLGAATNYSLTVTGDVSGTFPGPLTVTDLTIAGEAQGDLLYFNGSNWVPLPAGTSGEVLTTQGVGANPIWASAAGAGSAVLLWGNNTVGSTTTPRYLTPGYGESLSQTIAIQFRLPRSGTLQNMRVRHNAPGGNGNHIVYTLRVNGVATALSVSLASTSTDGSDLVGMVAVVAGDRMDIEVTKAASIWPGLTDITCSVEFI